MADVNISKFRTSVNRPGSAPASPGFAVSEGQDPVHPSGSSNFVTYSGATDNVDLGEFGLDAGFITLDTTPTNTPTAQGTIFWDADDETVDVILNGYTMKIGEDLFYPVKNQTGSTIAKGTAVRFNGTVGASGRLLIAPFIADGSVASSRFMGVTAEEILDGEDGKVLYFGRIRGINTDAFNEGDILYASTTVAGGFQTAIPVAPNNIVQVAAVVTKSINQGTIFVRPTLGSNINKDEGVKITSVANLDLLQYQSGTGLWENKTLAQVIGSDYVPSTRNITINGTTQDLSADRTFNVGTVTSVTASSPLFSSGGTTPNITIQQATATQNGFLSSTDWITFNSKQNALTNPVTGTGASGQVAYFNGTTSITSESNLFWDATNDRLGIGTNSPTERLEVNGNGLFSSSVKINTSGVTTSLNAVSSGLQLLVDGSTGSNRNITFNIASTEAMKLDNNGNLGLGVTPSAWQSFRGLQVGQVGAFASNDFGGGNIQTFIGNNVYYDNAGFKYIQSGTAAMYRMVLNGEFQWSQTSTSGTAGNAISFTQAMTLTSGGNLLVGTTTDNGARLQVSGTATVSDTLSVIKSSGTSAIIAEGTATNGEGLVSVRGKNSSGTSRRADFKYDNADVVRIATANPINMQFETNDTTRLTINGSTGSATFSSSVTATALTLTSTDSVIATNTSDGSDNKSINISGGGTQSIARGANLRLYGNEYTGEAGNVSLFSGNVANSNIVLNAYSSSSTIQFLTNNTERMRITSSGNVLIGTTTSGASKLRIVGLPTSSAGLSSGDVWNDGGTLKIA
jgi:hypothetical protein